MQNVGEQQLLVLLLVRQPKLDQGQRLLRRVGDTAGQVFIDMCAVALHVFQRRS